MRVIFQMSASDSASLMDAPDAATLGLNRALFYNDREGASKLSGLMRSRGTNGLNR